MKKIKVISLICNLVAIGLFIAGIILISSETNQTLGMALNSLGSIFLIFGIFLDRKIRKDEE